MYAGIRVLPCLLARQVWKEKENLYHLDYITKLLQYYYLTAWQQLCQTTEKSVYATFMQLLEAPIWQYEHSM